MKIGYNIPEREYIDKDALKIMIDSEGLAKEIESVESIYFPIGGDSLFSLHVNRVSIVYSEQKNLLIGVGEDGPTINSSLKKLVEEFRKTGILRPRA
ncbi:MAG: hypothetical protein Q8N63_02880 [Nanoarchaeota archaeon]|nr:hypothetical protein [Nanoarchaeota archaeon]